MNEQPLLRLFEVARGDERVTALVALLETSASWLTRAQLAERFGWSDREVRAVVAAAWDDNGPLVVKGQRGFAHWRHATIDEVNHAIRQREKQAEEDQRYAVGLRRRVHQRIGA